MWKRGEDSLYSIQELGGDLLCPPEVLIKEESREKRTLRRKQKLVK